MTTGNAKTTTPAQGPPQTVHQAIAAVMAAMPGIGKDDRSPEGYTYRGIEAITRHLQPLMARHGLVLVPTATVHQVVPSPAMKDGWQDVHMSVHWTVYGPDGSTVSATTCGIGRDRADKGANKAMTMALKYLLLSLFMVADKADDAEGHLVTPEGDRAASPAPGPRHAHQPREDLQAINTAFTDLGVPKDGRLAMACDLAGRQVERASDLTEDEAAVVLAGLHAMLDLGATVDVEVAL